MLNRLRFSFRAGAIVIALAAPACNDPLAEPPPVISRPTPTPAPLPGSQAYPDRTPQVFSGVLRAGYETLDLTPCYSQVRYSIANGSPADFSPHLGPFRDRIHNSELSPLQFFVQFRALVSVQGDYGHLGRHPRELWVLQVLEFRTVRPYDCFGP